MQHVRTCRLLFNTMIASLSFSWWTVSADHVITTAVTYHVRNDTRKKLCLLVLVRAFLLGLVDHFSLWNVNIPYFVTFSRFA